MVIRYVLAMIAGIWMADGLALLVAPRHVMVQVRDVLAIAPKILSWEGLAAGLGICLLAGTRGLHYEILWTMTGAAMVLKGVFLMMGPEPWRQRALEWCLSARTSTIDFGGLAFVHSQSSSCTPRDGLGRSK
ncbi:MAG TPA: hypothetical protein VJV04_07730 [Nitrospiraceae bacterium]|nr:hypothetical protein [Nitrospiraceae bacterium]